MESAGLYLYLVAYHFPALLEIGDYLRLGQCRDIVLGALQGDIAAAVKAVAPGDPAGGEPEHFTVLAFASQHGHHPVHRAHELDPAGTPAHAPGNGQLLDTAVDDVVEAGAGPGARHCAAQPEPGALGGFHNRQLLRLHALPAGKAGGGRGPVAVLVAGLGERRPQGFHLLVRCLQLYLVDQHRQPPGAGKPLYFAEIQLPLAQPGDDPIAKRQPQGFQGLGWQFLRAQLYQQGVSTRHQLASARMVPSTSSRSSGRARGKPSAARASK